MANCRFAGIAALALLAAAGVGTSALAQSTTAPPRSAPPKSVDPAFDSQKAAFLAMPEADRKAVQDALVWLGLYNGLVDGAFGKRTLDSIVAYQASAQVPADGVVSGSQLAALKTATGKARAGVGFQLLDDAATGIRIGTPMKLMEKKLSAAGQTQLTSRDGSITLDLLAPSGPQSSLAGLYSLLTAEAPNRKVTYKTIKPDAFFVVSGEAAARKFYLRYEQLADGGLVRGFSFAFPAARSAELDRVALALLNSFEPFPATTPAPPAKAPQASAASSSAPTGTVAPGAGSTPGASMLKATALIVASGQALTALSEADCHAPVIEGKPAKFSRVEAATGLALLSGEFAAAVAPLRLSAGSEDLIVFSLAAGAGNVVLEAANARLTPISEARQAVVAAISMSARGAPVFDRRAGFVSIVAPIAAEPNRFGAVVLAEPHELIDAEALKTFIPLQNVGAASARPPLRAAEIASEMRSAIVGVYCTQ